MNVFEFLNKLIGDYSSFVESFIQIRDPKIFSDLKQALKGGIRAIIIYPMNALANSQYGELEKFLCRGYPDNKNPVTFARYTGQEDQTTRERITHDQYFFKQPPDDTHSGQP